MFARSEIIADQVVSPSVTGGLRIYSPGRIVWNEKGFIESVEVFPRASLRNISRNIIRARVVTPGLIDSHTHAVFGGQRVHEWVARLEGATYESIKKKGGGIAFSVNQTRESSELDLLNTAQTWARKIVAAGTTTSEIKSGYGLNLETELKILRVVRRLRSVSPLLTVATFMGAHAIPKDQSEASYSEYLINDILPQIGEWAAFQDIFCEKGYFSVSWGRKILAAGKKWGLKPKVHAHEFGRSGGVQLAAECGAISAEHLMHLNDDDIRLLKRKKIVAVILPGTSFFLGGKKFAAARKLWDAKVKVAIATDYNPGSNPSFNLPLCGTFACVFQNLRPAEVLVAQTSHAAQALDLQDRGRLEPGLRADIVSWDLLQFEEIYYRYGESRVALTVIGGQKAFSIEKTD